MRSSKKLTAIVSVCITAGIFAFTACKKNDVANTDGDTGFATDQATLEKTFSDAQSIADQAGETGNLADFRTTGSTTVLSSCATVTRDTTVTPHTITIDFGTTNCLCNDGVYRRGQILVSYSGQFHSVGSTHSITFNNYFQNDNGVSGLKTVTFASINAAGHPVYTVSDSGNIVLANAAGTISWVSIRTRTWYQGYNTPAWNDDKYEVTGSGTITRASGRTFTMLITSPLHIALNCHWIESGVISITPSGAAVRTLDYGTGTCDALATMTVNGHTYNVTLH